MIGCDIVEIERVEKAADKYGDKFIGRILTSAEAAVYTERGRKAEFLAGRFSAKEAVSKAMGCGIGTGLAFTDIEILPDMTGRPEVALKGVKRDDISVSISHSRYNAIAVCHIKEAP